MDPNIIGVFIPILAILCTAFILYIYFVTRNRERLSMIEKGMQLDFNSKKRKHTGALKWGMLMAGIGIGLMLGHIAVHLHHADHEEAGIYYFIMMLIFGGLALILFHFIDRKKEGKVDSKPE